MSSKQSGRFKVWLVAIILTLLFSSGSLPAADAQRLLNVNFGSGAKLGAAAIGNGTNDAWNLITASNFSTTTNLMWASSNATTISLTMTNFGTATTLSIGDAMMNSLVYGPSIDGEYNSIPASLVISNLPAGTYEIYVYSLGWDYTQNGTWRAQVASGTPTGWKYTAHPGYVDDDWTEDVQYVKFTSVVVTNGQTVTLESAGNSSYTHLVNGIQIIDPSSTNSPLPAVSFSPASGASVPVSVTLSVSGHGDAVIYYTTNGSDPTTNSSVYSSALSITTPTTVKAFATKSNYFDSAISSASYVLPTLPSVTFSPATGAEVPLSLTLSISGHGDATIYYTTNNTTPTTGSSVYSSAVSLSTEVVVKAFGVKTGYYDSSVASANYYLPTAPTPTIYPVAGSYYIPLTVTISNSLSGADVRYSTNGSAWQTYSAAMEFSDDVVVRAKVVKAGYYDSATVTNAFVVDPFPIPATEILPDGGIFTNAASITLSNSTAGVLIQYRVGVSTNWNTYSSPFSLDGIDAGTGFLEVRASKTNCVTSTVTSDMFVFITSAPIFSHTNGHYTNSFSLTLTNSTPSSTNFYSMDGTTWLAYSGPLTIESSMSVAARTAKAGYVSNGHVSHQSWEGFTSTQGLNNWYYLYSTNAGGLPASFLPLYDTTNAVWRLTGNNTNCQVGWAFQRPGETNDSVRSFQSPYPGTAIISGLAFLDDLTAEESVMVRILKNDDTILDWTEITASTPVMLNVLTNLNYNDEIHFQVEADESEVSHRLNFYPQVAFQHYRTFTFQDTDGDGLSDALEAGQGTDPDLVDTDGDGVNDYLEWKLGRNPLVAGTTADTTGGTTKLKTFTPLE